MDIEYARGKFEVAITSLIYPEKPLLERFFSGYFTDLMDIQYRDTPHIIAESILSLQFAIRSAIKEYSLHHTLSTNHIIQIIDKARITYDQILKRIHDSDISAICIPLIREEHSVFVIHTELFAVVHWILTSSEPLVKRIQNPSYSNTILAMDTTLWTDIVYDYGSFCGQSVHEVFCEHKHNISLFLKKINTQEVITDEEIAMLVGTTLTLYEDITVVVGIIS